MPSTPPPPDTTVPTTTTILPPPPRKFPAPCWTQDETLALIHCYQDKWFSLRRRNLRTADWEAVAADVNHRCPNQSPPKTSAQCRHKMEKLRKRYRAEKQRISNLPLHHLPNNSNHRFYPSSSWVFFDLMDSMELGSGPGSTSIIPTPPPPPSAVSNHNHNHALFVKERNINTSNGNFQNGFGSNVNVNDSNGGGGREDLGKYFDEILRSVGKSGIAAPSTKFKVNNPHSRHLNHNPLHSDKRYFDHEDGDDDHDDAEYDDSRFDHHLFNSKKRKFVGGERERISRGVPGSNGFPPFSSMSSKRGGGGGRGEEVVGEMVESIKMLGEGMVKMEKMKMELMQDLEKQRMEMEMNNTRLILESQHNIVTAFLRGFQKQHHHHHNHSNNKKLVKVVQMD